MSVTEKITEGPAGGKRMADNLVTLLAPPQFRGRQIPFLGLFIILGLLAPVVLGGDAYDDGILNSAMVYSILTLGFFWCFSLAGNFTFAVYGVYAAGAYISIWAASNFGGFWSGFIAATVLFLWPVKSKSEI